MADKVITDAGVIEQIRAALPVATREKNGLMQASIANRFMITNISLQPGESKEITPVCGLVYITNRYVNDGKGTLYACGYSSIERIGGYNDVTLSLTVSDKKLVIKNNYSSAYSASVVYQDLS